MSIQQVEFFAAYQAMKAQRAVYDSLMEQIQRGEPYDQRAVQVAIEEMDVLHKVFLEKSEPFVRWKR